MTKKSTRGDDIDQRILSEIEAMLACASTDTRAAVAALALPGRVLAFSPHHAALRPRDQTRLAELVEQTMSTRGFVDSATGISAALAMNWCERNNRSYCLKRRGDQYSVEILS